MKRLCLLLLAALASAQALAVGHLAHVSITDRDTGTTLAAHYHRGEYWVAGRPGARYAINIRNTQGLRVLAVTSVDGINVITGDTARSDQRGYVFDPYVGYDIAGWRKSDAQVAAFEFTSVPRSYAARTGRPQNVGVIGVALFRERAAVVNVQSAQHRFNESPPPSPVSRSRGESESLDTAAASAGQAAGRATERRSESLARSPGLGTGHGRRETSVVTNVDFVREQQQPNEVVRIRYDSEANLLAMGVIRRAPTVIPQPRPFPDEPALGYVPDP